MRTLPTLLLALAFLMPLPLAMSDPTGNDPCHDREHTCTNVEGGTMTCGPEAGTANSLAVVVGSANSGTFNISANGTNPGLPFPCEFKVVIDASGITFDAGYGGYLGTPGGVTATTSSPCYAAAGRTCQTTATFTWWRAVHGVTFDIPFDLYANGVRVARGSCHYYDPPMLEEVAGGPVVVP
jgi:hypothetical protein